MHIIEYVLSLTLSNSYLRLQIIILISWYIVKITFQLCYNFHNVIYCKYKSANVCCLLKFMKMLDVLCHAKIGMMKCSITQMENPAKIKIQKARQVLETAHFLCIGDKSLPIPCSSGSYSILLKLYFVGIFSYTYRFHSLRLMRNKE